MGLIAAAVSRQPPIDPAIFEGLPHRCFRKNRGGRATTDTIPLRLGTCNDGATGR